MKKPFDEKALPLDVRKHYKENRNVPSNILAYLEEHYHDQQMENMQLALFFSFIEIEFATTVYVDEVGEVLKKARARLERFSDFPQVVSFLRELEKLEGLEKRRRNRLDKLLTMDFDSLDRSEKKGVAYGAVGFQKYGMQSPRGPVFFEVVSGNEEPPSILQLCFNPLSLRPEKGSDGSDGSV